MDNIMEDTYCEYFAMPCPVLDLRSRLAAAEADNAHLREGLEKIASDKFGYHMEAKYMQDIARATLEGGSHE